MSRSINELVEAIQTHEVELNRTAMEADQLGAAPASLVDIMRTIRVPMVKVPAEAGGDNLTLFEQVEFFAALSYVNATAGWVGFNHAGAASAAAAKLPAKGFAEVFGDDAVPFFAGVAAPTGQYKTADDGVVVSGRWKFASGCTHAEWALLTTVEVDGGGGICSVVIPQSEFDVTGEWNVMALKGTGSLDIECDDVFVPLHRTIEAQSNPERGGPEYAIPYPAYVAGENLGFTLGVTERFVDEAILYAKSKSRGFGSPLARRGAFEYEIGKARMQIASVRALGIDTMTKAWDQCQSLGIIDNQGIGGMMACVAYGSELCAEVVSHLYHFLGASAIFEGSVLARCFRDVHGSVQHLVASNEAYDRLGNDILT